jgi:hypothetical protein
MGANKQMNASHITGAVAAMEVAIGYLRAIPFSTGEEFQERWKAMDGLAVSASQLKAQMSRIEIEVQADK